MSTIFPDAEHISGQLYPPSANIVPFVGQATCHGADGVNAAPCGASYDESPLLVRS